MAVEWENGIPILTGESMLSDVPEYTQALAGHIGELGGDGGGSVDPLDIARAANPVGTSAPDPLNPRRAAPLATASSA